MHSKKSARIKTAAKALAAFCLGLSCALGAPRANDFTQSNLTLKKDEMEKKAFQSKDAPADWTKSFEKKDFKSDTDAKWIQDKKVRFQDGLTGSSLIDKKSGLGESKYAPPELGGDLSDKKWTGKTDEAYFKNRDKNLNKDYSGSIDFNQKNLSDINKKYAERMEEIQENSMRELNKFFSRNDFEDGDIPVSKAGAQGTSLAPQTDGLLATLGISETSDVGRPVINLDRSAAFGAFRGAKRSGELKNYEDVAPEVSETAPARGGATSATPQNSARASVSTPFNTAASMTKKSVSASGRTIKKPDDDGKVKIAEKHIDTSGYKGSFFGLPKDLQSGDAKIEVKVNR